LAIAHSRGGIFHCFSEWFKTRNKSWRPAKTLAPLMLW
jgi:hypothetical protein